MRNFTGRLDDITGTTLTEGTWNVSNGAALTFANYTGGITINQANVTLNGPNAGFPPINALADIQGTFSLLALRQFNTAGDLSNEGAIVLDAGSTLHVTGNFAMADASAANSLNFVIGGDASAGVASPGILQAGGTATLAGSLHLTFASHASFPGSNDTLTILSAKAISGSFANAPGGTRLMTTDGNGSFVVTYNPTSVVLGQFLPPGQSVPVSTVTITPGGDGEAIEGGAVGIALVKRTGDTGTALMVRYKVRGSARVGVEYKPVTGTVTIPAGAAKAKIKIRPIDSGALAAGTFVAKIRLKASATGSYTLGSPAVANLKVIDKD